MSVHIEDLEDSNRSLKCNAWNWRSTAKLIIESGLLSDEDKAAFEAGCGGLEDSQAKALVRYFREKILPSLSSGQRINLDGTVTQEPDNGTFHRQNLAKNYGASREWLEEFTQFIETCKGFCVG